MAAAHAQESDPVREAAEAYAAFRIDVAALGGSTLSTPADLERALERAARHNRDALSRGWIAYGALQAERSPAFAAGVASVARRYGRTAVLQALARDPAYPSRRRGYSDAIARLLAVSAADAQAARAAAVHIEAEASRPHVWASDGAAEARAARLRALGAARFVSRAETRTAVINFPATAPAQRLHAAPRRGEMMRTMASLAAMRLLNARGDWRAPMRRMLADGPTRGCIELEQLQFLQCVSVTHVIDEAAFCLSRHALQGVNACMNLSAE